MMWPYSEWIVGLGSDGAAEMAGELNGLNALMKVDNPFTIIVHCVCHRLNLAAFQVKF